MLHPSPGDSFFLPKKLLTIYLSEVIYSLPETETVVSSPAKTNAPIS
jgi:hypothetical protein